MVAAVADGRQATRAWPLGTGHWGAGRPVSGLLGRRRAAGGGVPAMKQNGQSIKTENRM